MLAQSTGMIVVTGISVAGLFGMILGVVYWVANTRVPNKQCDIVRKNNEQTHKSLTDYIAAAENRANERHKELKDDLGEIKVRVCQS